MPEPDPARTKTRRRRLPAWARTSIQLVLTVAVTWFIVDRVGVDMARLAELDFTAWRLRWGHLVLSVLVLLAGYAVSAALWGRMVRELGGPRMAPRRSIQLFLVANLGRYVPGKVLQLAGLTILAGRQGVRPGTAAVAAVLGQGIALLGATVVGLGAFVRAGPDLRLLGWIGLAIVLAFLVLGSLPFARRALVLVWRKFERSGPEESPPRALTDVRFVWRWTLWYSLNWLIYAVAFWLLFGGLAGPAPFIQVGPAFAAAYVVGYLAVFAPAGLGVRESFLAVFLAPVLAAEPALALAVVARLWTTLVEIVPAALFAPGALRGVRHPEESPPTPT